MGQTMVGKWVQRKARDADERRADCRCYLQCCGRKEEGGRHGHGRESGYEGQSGTAIQADRLVEGPPSVLLDLRGR